MKTPEENKCGMECIRTNVERVCIKPEKGQCPRCKQLVDECIASLRQLESRLAQVERERDALMESVKGCCETCAFVGDCAKHDPDPTSTGAWWYDDCEEWQWRGVCEENTKEE